jgi:hypothetical protein
MSTPRHSKFELNATERLIQGVPASSQAFSQALLDVSLERIDYLVQAYVRDRTPAAFETVPLLWGAIRSWLTSRVNKQCQLSLAPWEWGLNGSANLGFSAAPDKFGIPFGSHSDLDFFIVNENLYEKVCREARQFSISDTDMNKYQNARETVTRQLTRGLFLDTKQIPAFEKFPTNALLLNEISMVVDKLRIEGYPIARSFVRVYKNWQGLAYQLRLNVTTLRKSLYNKQNNGTAGIGI